ncbi:MAG: LicD family protein [Clostridia bacterium]|nr:LicD family protein [Clostridia bacterium]
MVSEIKDFQKCEYDILKETDRVCKKHDIKYFLGQGSLLGAAKYGGFIPWDDDIDLLIPYDQLDKLMKVFPLEAADNLLLTNYKVERYFPLAWSKIRDKNTLSRPVRYKDIPINWGVCIDLFPIYPVSNNSFIRETERILYKIANKIMQAEFTKYEENHNLLVRILERVPIFIRHMYLKTVNALLSKHKDTSQYVLMPCKGVKIVRRELIFGSEQFLKFEDGVYPVPARYDEYLRLNYGDYMAPLPQGEQRGHDLKMGEIEWKFDLNTHN